ALPEWGTMLNSASFDGDPGPWSPADHPDWEKDYQSSLPYVERYRQATQHQDYATAVRFSPDEPVQLMLNILLPELSPHRTMVKQIIANAWREENGRVDPNKMIDAWRTSLDAADHVSHGVSLIERLVAISESTLTYETARRALAQNVFRTPQQMSEALKTLREHSHPPADPAEWLRGELAFAMDTVQYTTTVGPDGQPRFDLEKATKIAAYINNEGQPKPEDVATILAKDPRQVTANFRSAYTELADTARVGYPTVTAKSLDDITDRYVKANPEMGFIMPSFGRVYALQARAEASRRATQLAYA